MILIRRKLKVWIESPMASSELPIQALCEREGAMGILPTQGIMASHNYWRYCEGYFEGISNAFLKFTERK